VQPSRADFLSPVVRRLVAEHALDPDEIHGTGADGRVTRADVMAAIAARAAAPTPTAAPAPPTMTSTGDHVVPFTPMRTRIAAHMAASVATSPHAFCSVVVDFQAVDRVRRAASERWLRDEGFGLTYLPFVARAVVDALRDRPELNASMVEDGLRLHRSVHLGVAVDLDREGLVVPVVRDADVKRLRGIARDASALADRARSGQLVPDDVGGATITITNPGAFGTVLSVPIINQPQVAIVVTDRVRKAPVVVPTGDGGEGIGVHAVATVGVSFDHRAVGMASAAAFLERVRDVLEHRDWSIEL
jgi:2-oxoglutarate dehydrogenase E2 component (dihydrolipoamide succinyltransferase)